MPHFRTCVTPCCWCRCWRCCCCSCCCFGSLSNLTHIQLAKCTWKCTCNPMPELSGGTISWGRCTSIGNAACCQDVLSPQQLHHPKRMQEIITQTHTRSPTQSDCHVRQAEGGAKKEAKGSVQQRWKNCHVHESRLINSKSRMHNTTAYSLSAPTSHLLVVAFRWPPPCLMAHSIEMQMSLAQLPPTATPRISITKWELSFTSCFCSLVAFVSFFRVFFSSLSLFVVVIFCVLRCICCSDFSGAYHQSGKSSGKLAACCTQLFACHLMHFLFSSRQLL